MSIIGQNILAGASGGGDYDIPYGAHGDAQANAGAMPGNVTITRTPGVAPTADGTFTISTWFKMGATPGVTGANTGLTYLFNAGPDANSFQCYFLNGFNKQLAILGNHASEANWARYPNCVWRDTAQWYHLVMALDTTEASAANRVKVWINGTQVSNFGTNTNPDNGENLFWGENAVEQSILTYSSYYGDQYMSEIISVDGQALTAGDFGTASTNGQWIPIEYKGTFGTNGFYLDWADAADMGKDASGNGNDFTVSNFNAYNRVMDSPTNNWCTPNVLTPPYGINTYYWSGLKITTDATAYWDASPSTWEVSSGKWYYEMYKGSGNPYPMISATRPIPNYYVTGGQNNPQDAAGGILYKTDGQKIIDGTSTAYGASWSDGDLIGTAVNFDDNEVTFYKNGVSQGVITFAGRCATSTHFVVGFAAYNATYYQNYGQDSSFCGQKTSGSAAASDANGYGDFYYSVPTGFLAMCQKNMPDPVITVPRDLFTIDAWTGDNSASRDITTPFQPDFVWIKRTDGQAQHMIFDAVRGVHEYLGSNTTTKETNETDTLTAFNSNGYTIGNHSHINDTGETYVGWAWKLGNGTVSNTDGDITSTVSADVTAGMSILKYTGTNAAGATVGHGLGV